jgi:hypothetical protein
MEGHSQEALKTLGKGAQFALLSSKGLSRRNCSGSITGGIRIPIAIEAED